jgi:hypothetical protein
MSNFATVFTNLQIQTVANWTLRCSTPQECTCGSKLSMMWSPSRSLTPPPCSPYVAGEVVRLSLDALRAHVHRCADCMCARVTRCVQQRTHAHSRVLGSAVTNTYNDMHDTLVSDKSFSVPLLVTNIQLGPLVSIPISKRTYIHTQHAAPVVIACRVRELK